MTTRVLVTGAGGFIGHHLVTYLKERGYWVRGVDMKLPEYTAIDADEFEIARPPPCGRRRLQRDARDVDQVYALAADMGGMGFISPQPRHDPPQQRAHRTSHDRGGTRARRRALPLHLVRVHLSGAPAGPTRTSRPLREEDAYPADPQDAYGWEKLVAERLCEYYAGRVRHRDADRALPQHLRAVRDLRRRAREGARRAVPQGGAGRADGGSIEVWGDGEQTRSFCYIDDCVEGIHRLMQSDYREPLNLGTDRMVSDQRARRDRHGHRRQASSPSSTSTDPRACAAATRTTPGCARCSAGSRRIKLEEGLAETYRWIEEQVAGL